MKNSRITFTQFCFLSTISVFASLLFIDSSASLFQPLLCGAALGINGLFIAFYRGRAGAALKLAASAYAGASAVASSIVFVSYICGALGYGPCWLITVILFGFSFFCAVKGIEAAARASLIVGAVVLISIIYITVSTAPMVDYRFSFMPVFSPVVALILLFPSASYILLYENIIPGKKYNFFYFAAFTVVSVAFFTLVSSGVTEAFPVRVLPSKAQIDIFKGSDGLLLTVLTLATVYINTISTLSVIGSRRHNYLANSVYLAVLAAVAVGTLSLI